MIFTLLPKFWGGTHQDPLSWIRNINHTKKTGKIHLSNQAGEVLVVWVMGYSKKPAPRWDDFHWCRPFDPQAKKASH